MPLLFESGAYKALWPRVLVSCSSEAQVRDIARFLNAQDIAVQHSHRGRHCLLCMRPLPPSSAAQLERLEHRDKCSRQLAEAKIAAQMPLERKAALADHIIDNSGDRAALESQAGAPPTYAVVRCLAASTKHADHAVTVPGARAGKQVDTVSMPARATDVPCHCGRACVAYSCSVLEEVRSLSAA